MFRVEATIRPVPPHFYTMYKLEQYFHNQNSSSLPSPFLQFLLSSSFQSPKDHKQTGNKLRDTSGKETCSNNSKTFLYKERYVIQSLGKKRQIYFPRSKKPSVRLKYCHRPASINNVHGLLYTSAYFLLSYQRMDSFNLE